MNSKAVNWGLVLAIAAVVLVSRSPVLLLSFFSGDEATYSALASKLLSGALPYSGAVDHKPPGIGVTYAAIYGLLGRNHILTVRIFMMLTVVATSLVIGKIAGRLYGRREAGAAGLIYAAASVWGMPGDMQAANTELFLNLPLVLAGWSTVSSNDRNGTSFWLRLFAAGLLTGVAGLYKYQAALAGGAWAVYVWFSVAGTGKRLSGLSALAAGFLTVVAGYLGFFIHAGAWNDFVQWGWRFNFKYMSTLSNSEIALNALKYFILVGFCWLPLLLVLRRPVGSALRLAVPWLVLMLLVTGAGGRFFPHYFIMALPALCLLSVPGWLPAESVADERGRSRRSRLRKAALVLAVVFTVLSTTFAWLWYVAKPHLREYDAKYRTVGNYIRANSGPEEMIFVWGNSPEIYYYSDRVMGTRFPFCNYHTGKIWGSKLDDRDAVGTEAYIVPEAWTQLMQDLEAVKPLLIIDGGAGKLDRFDNHPAARYPQLDSFIKANYSPFAVVDGVPVYRRTVR